jgi:hypothetical protein
MKRFNSFTLVAVASLVFALTVMSGGVAGAVPVITNGLVAAYEFNGNANDVSGNGNDGVVKGATLTTDRFGNLDSAYDFDGNAMITASPTVPIPHTNTVSARVWLATLGAFQYVVDLGDNNNWIEILPSGTFRTGTTGLGETLDTVTLATHQWYMLTRTFDGTNQKSYVDGLLVGTVAGIANNPTAITIGAHNSRADQGVGLVGKLDDVYIYDRALSPTEVSTLYSVIPEPSTALLLGIGLSALAVRREKR